MKNYIRTALDTLAGLGFDLDHEDRKLRTDRWIFTHANAPEDRLTLNYRMSEPAARTVVQRAKQIVGLATVGSETKKPKRDHRERMEQAANRRRREAAHALAEARRNEEQAQRDAAAVAKRRNELDRLLVGRADQGVTVDGIADDSMLTVEQVADTTGITDLAVRRAIAADKLTAYQCGKVVKVKGADVRRWLAAS